MRAWPSNKMRAPGCNISADLVSNCTSWLVAKLHWTVFTHPLFDWRYNDVIKAINCRGRPISGSDSCNRRANASVWLLLLTLDRSQMKRWTREPTSAGSSGVGVAAVMPG
jgi:hypothetical protein